MVLGTSSSVGKSLLVAALCRLFARRGLRVAPFKAQNMSNNAAVCADGAEIGRAQALQAAAARIAPTADMNPVLLKPEADSRAHVIVHGKPWQTLSAASYRERKQTLWPIVTAALERLRAEFELVVIEGAGSPVELNLRGGDIVNMAVARHAGAPVLLAGDIDRGGIFAQLLGTLWLLPPEERALVRGLVVNKFRGDPALFTDGISILQQRAEVPVLGVVPYVRDLGLPEEDAVALDEPGRPTPQEIDIAIIRLPHIANFDDFDLLFAGPGLRVRYVTRPEELGAPRAVILPGTKSTVADLAWLRSTGFAEALVQLVRQGTALAGICGGYQMLGRRILDPSGVESCQGEATGLGLLPIETRFEPAKATRQVRARVGPNAPGWLNTIAGAELHGYEIHMGRTESATPWLQMETARDGAATENGRIWGCYLHGIFANDVFRRAWLASLGLAVQPADPRQAALERGLDRLADAVAGALNMGLLDKIIDGR
jgi:adenosylcobyric acid synthase